MIGLGAQIASIAITGNRVPGPPPEEEVPVLYTAAVIGQSENVVGWLDNSNFSTGNDIYPDVAAGVDMEIMIPRAANEGVSTHGIYPVTQAVAAARDISPGAVAIANLWHLGSGGEALRLAGVCVSGTGMTDLMDDALTNRSFSEDKALVDDAIAAWGPISRVTYNWYVSEAGASHNLWENRSAHFFGINADGSDYDFAAGDLDHCLIDTTDRGFGMFEADTRVDVMYPGNYIRANAHTLIAPENRNYMTEADGSNLSGRTVQNGQPAYQARRDFLSAAPSANAGIATISPALAVMGDYVGGVQKPGSAQVSSHPGLQTKYGQILYSQDVAFSLLCSYGFATPTRLNRTEVASDGAYVDFIFDLPAGATLTTQRLQEGLSVSSPRPHQQEVMGLVIWRDGDTRQTAHPVYRTDTIDPVAYPTAYRGTVHIHDTGTDVVQGREGVLRVTPQEPFANGDKVEFGADGGYGGFILNGHPDYDAQLALDGLRAHEARLDDSTLYAYPGSPVVNQEEVIVTGVDVVDPPVQGTRVSKVNGENAWLSGPAVGAGVSEITMLFEGRIGYQSGFGRKGLLGLNSNGVRLEADTRSSQRKARVIVEDGNGTVLFSKFFGANSIAPLDTDDMSLMLSVTQDDGNGTARMALYLDGVLQDVVETAPSSTAPVFEAIQTFEVLNGNVGSTTGRVAIWAAYSPDGTEPTTGLIADHLGDATYWNGAGLPAGWSKQGADLFVDE